MSAHPFFDRAAAMASPWRRRRPCLIIIDGAARQAALRDISGSGARLDLTDPPAIGTPVALRHPEAGEIAAQVAGHRADGVLLAFDGSEAAVAFALAAILSDMSSPVSERD
jgi:hypothetical protein